MPQSSMPAQITPAADRPRPRVERIAEQVLLGGGQLLLAGVVAIVWEFTARSLGLDESRQFPLETAGPQILTACCIAMLGFLLAWLIVRLFPGAAAAGRWVWLPPTALLALFIGRSVLGDGWDWQSISARYFWTYQADMVGPIYRNLFTYPTLSAIAYSLGVRVRVLQCRRGGVYFPSRPTASRMP